MGENDGHHDSRLGLFSGTSIVPTHLGHHIHHDYVYVPTYGLELGQSITPWLGIAIHNEVELQHIVILDQEGDAINRNVIYLISGLLYLVPFRHFGVYIGPGHEFTGNQHYWLYKLGFEYAFHIAHGWDLAPEIGYDYIGNTFHTFTFGLTVGKSFNL